MTRLIIADQWPVRAWPENEANGLLLLTNPEWEKNIPADKLLTQARVLEGCGYDADTLHVLLNRLAHPIGMGYVLARYLHQEIKNENLVLDQVFVYADSVWAYGLLHRMTVFDADFQCSIHLKESPNREPESFMLPDYWLTMLRNQARKMQDSRTRTVVQVMPHTPPEQLVSGVVTCKNLGTTITETVDSVTHALNGGSLVVVDDGSDDPYTRDALENLACRIIRLNGDGVCAARNAGIEATDTPYILLWDGDDLIEPDFVKQAISLMETHPDVGAVYSWVRKFGAEQDIDIRWNFILPWGLCKNCGYALMMIRREAVDQCGGFDETMGNGFEDWELLLRLVENEWQCITIPEVLTHYRIQNDGMLRTMNRRKRAEQMAKIMDRHHALYERYASDIIQLCQNNTDFFQQHYNPALCSPTPAVDSTAAVNAFSRMFESLAKRGLEKVIILGAGKHTEKASKAFCKPRVNILAFADDKLAGTRFYGHPVISLTEADALNPDAVIISSDTRQHELVTIATERFHCQEIYPLYSI